MRIRSDREYNFNFKASFLCYRAFEIAVHPVPTSFTVLIPEEKNEKCYQKSDGKRDIQCNVVNFGMYIHCVVIIRATEKEK